MEIVSKPDLRSADEAKAYLTKLRTILRYLGTCDGNMDEGSLRADVNVSVRRPGEPFGTRCEIKNVNSIRFVGQAIEYEARRQIAILEDGGSIDQETRLFDPGQGRDALDALQGRGARLSLFPRSGPVCRSNSTHAFVDALANDLPELPDDKRARLIATLGLSAYDASILVSEKAIADYFEKVAAGRDGKAAANWVINDLLGRAEQGRQGHRGSSRCRPTSSAPIIDLIKEGTISGKIAKDLFEIVWTEGGDPRALVESRGMKQVTDTGAIEKAVDEVIAANPDKVEQARAKPTMAGWFVGQVMKATGGKANPQAVNELVKAKLGHRGLGCLVPAPALGERRPRSRARRFWSRRGTPPMMRIYGADKVAEITGEWHSLLRSRPA